MGSVCIISHEFWMAMEIVESEDNVNWTGKRLCYLVLFSNSHQKKAFTRQTFSLQNKSMRSEQSIPSVMYVSAGVRCVWRYCRLTEKTKQRRPESGEGGWRRKVGEGLVTLIGLSAHRPRWVTSVIIGTLHSLLPARGRKLEHTRQRRDKRGVIWLQHGIVPNQ